MRSNGSGSARRPVHPERTIQEYLAIISRGKWIALSCLAGCLLAAFLYSELATPVYKATSTVLIDQRATSSPLTTEGTTRGNFQNVRNELEVLRSRSIADTVARRLLEIRYADTTTHTLLPALLMTEGATAPNQIVTLGEVIGRLYGMVDFEPLRETDVIKITAQSGSPEEAALVANLYAQAYYDRNIFNSRAHSRALREFLEAQMRDKRGTLDETEQAMQQYMETQGIVSLDDESRKTIEQLSQLEANRDATDISIKSLTRTLESYKAQFPQQELDVARQIGEGNDQYIKGLQEQIAQLEVTKDVTIAQNPLAATQDVYAQKLKEIDDQITALRTKLRARTDEFISTLPAGKAALSGPSDPAGYLKQLKQNIAETEIELQSLRAKKSALDGVIRGYNAQFERIPRKSIQFAKLQRAKLSNEKLFLLVESKFNEAAIAERSEFGYITIMDPAVVPRSPASPKLLLNLLLGLALGLALGLGSVFIREYLDVKVQAPEDLKKKGWTMLAAVMKMDGDIREVKEQGEAGRYAREVDPHLLTLMMPFSPISEAYRLLRTALHSPRSATPPKTVLITSPNPGEGKTTTVCNLAVAFAQTGKKVLLMDCDLRKPNVHNLFNIEMKPGLSELLFKLGAHELSVQTSVIKNLDIICAGALSPNPSEILGSREMGALVEQVKREYDIILLDASPVLAATDAPVVSTFVDAVVLVVSSGSTRMTDIERTLEMLESVGGKLLGFVLNNLDLQKAYGLAYTRQGYGYYGYSYQSNGKNGKAGKKKVKK
jgi:capsular exopolysaccharide synthesis family protein